MMCIKYIRHIFVKKKIQINRINNFFLCVLFMDYLIYMELLLSPETIQKIMIQSLDIRAYN